MSTSSSRRSIDRFLPRISIVVPSMNQGRFLEHALRSIFDQRYPSLEVVVMDGGSADESVSIIRRHADQIAYWQSQPDGGQAAAINAGMQRCSGDLVTWLNADDFYWEDALWVVGRAFARNPGHALYVGNGFRYADASGRRTPFCPGHVVFNRRALAEGLDYVLQPSTFVLRAAWDEAGGLVSHLHYGLDWDLFLRIGRDHPVVTINELLAVSREYDGTKTSRGGLRRALELVDIARSTTGRPMTPGAAYYLVGALREAATELPSRVTGALDAAMDELRASMRQTWGGDGIFPDRPDVQDVVDVPLAPDAEPAQWRASEDAYAPSMSVMVLAPGPSPRISRALDSLHAQRSPGLQVIVVHPPDERPRLEEGSRLADAQVIPLAGPWTFGRALQAGLEAATGDVITWLDGGDRLAAHALERVARAFADPSVDVVAGHAMYVGEDGRAEYIRTEGETIGVRWAVAGGNGRTPRRPLLSERARVFVRARALAAARSVAGRTDLATALARVLEDGTPVVVERILWLQPPAEARAAEDLPSTTSSVAGADRVRPTLLERWVATLPRDGVVRRLGRAVVRRVGA